LELWGFRMKNRFLALGMLVMALVFGMTSCPKDNTDGGGGGIGGGPPQLGRLTITGLDSYNNKFAIASSEAAVKDIVAFEEYFRSGAKISDGQVILNIWEWTLFENGIWAYTGYSRSETRQFTVYILSKADIEYSSGTGVATINAIKDKKEIGKVTATFTSGVGTGTIVHY